jgi:hypothetical protein
MQTPRDSKYALKDLHQDIDLFDRKIAHCQSHGEFGSEKERAVALQKLVTKRDALVKTAMAMAGRGVECDPKYLPRSFKEAASSAKVAS